MTAIQERQMTTVPDANIHCVSVLEGSFDDCQDIVKAAFADKPFRYLGIANKILVSISVYSHSSTVYFSPLSLNACFREETPAVAVLTSGHSCFCFRQLLFYFAHVCFERISGVLTHAGISFIFHVLFVTLRMFFFCMLDALHIYFQG